MVLQNGNTEFQPADPLDLLMTLSSIDSTLQCYTQCNLNVRCRTFIYSSKSQQCSLYEGSIDTGNVVAVTSNETTSVVGGLVYTSQLFVSYGQTCDRCSSSRYLTCVNAICQCLPNTYWNGSMCLNQGYYGHTCTTGQPSCRTADLSLSCLSNCLVCASSSTACTVPSNASEPIAYWPFDNTLGDNTTTAVGNISFANGHLEQAVQLTGALYIWSTAFHNISYRSFTIEMWIYPTSILLNMPLFSQVASPEPENAFDLWIVVSKLYTTFGWDDTEGSTTLQENQWYHVAFVYNCNNRSAQFFLNGIEEAISHPTGTGASPYQGQCGAIEIDNNYPNVQFVGLIDEVTLWDRVRTPSEILADATTSG